MMMDMKVCSACGAEKELSSFTFDSTRGRYVSKCKECRAEYLRKYRKANIERTRQLDRNWAAKNKDKICEKNKKRYVNLSLDQKMQMLLKTASGDRRKFEVLVTLEDLKNLWEKQKGRCAYTQLPLTPEGHQLNTMSIDRIDSSKHYTVDNIQFVCVPVNRMKLDLEESVFLNLCFMIAQNNKQPDTLSS
jgi:hypothetical protein